MNDRRLDDLARAQRLQELGLTIRSGELEQLARDVATFYTSGNRAMRRARPTDREQPITVSERRRRRAKSKSQKKARRRSRV